MLWTKSTKCDTANCVEVSVGDRNVVVRNSRVKTTYVTFTPEEWKVFIEGAKAGEFDVKE